MTAAQGNENLRRQMLQRMLLIRCFEQRVKQLYQAGEIVGAIHLYIGQEAVAAGTCAALGPDDYVASTHRSHGHAIAKGLEPKRMLAEMMGREAGVSRGRGGSMHLFDIGRGFLGGNGIVGGGIAIALGAAFSARYRGTGQVAVAFFGEGACNQGVVHECLNMAALWRLPVIYVCENNGYAATTPVSKSTCTQDIAPRAAAYGLPWRIADGNDVLAVYENVREAVARARGGEGATFIECKTYRVEPHCGIIADGRDRDEVGTWRDKGRDPIGRLEALLSAENGLQAHEIAATRAAVEKEIDDAVAFARGSPTPAAESAGRGLWSE